MSGSELSILAAELSVSGDLVSANVVWDVNRPSGVIICVRRLATAVSEKLRIEPSGVLLERPYLAVACDRLIDDDDGLLKHPCCIYDYKRLKNPTQF